MWNDCDSHSAALQVCKRPPQLYSPSCHQYIRVRTTAMQKGTSWTANNQQSLPLGGTFYRASALSPGPLQGSSRASSRGSPGGCQDNRHVWLGERCGWATSVPHIKQNSRAQFLLAPRRSCFNLTCVCLRGAAERGPF